MLSQQKAYKSWFFEQVDRYLGSKELKKTFQRAVIMNKILSKGGHLSAEDLFSHLKSDGNNIGLATIYRTLRLLKESGVIEEHSFVEGKSIFELSFPNKHHDHLICMGCHSVIEFLDPKIEEHQEQVAKNNQFVLVKHTMNLFGYCKKCQKNSM